MRDFMKSLFNALVGDRPVTDSAARGGLQRITASSLHRHKRPNWDLREEFTRSFLGQSNATV